MRPFPGLGPDRHPKCTLIQELTASASLSWWQYLSAHKREVLGSQGDHDKKVWSNAESQNFDNDIFSVLSCSRKR